MNTTANPEVSKYDALLAMPISDRTAQYNALTPFERQYVNNLAAQQALATVLMQNDITNLTDTYTQEERPVLIGKIELLKQEIAEQSILLGHD